MRVGHGTAALPVPEGTPMGGYAARVGGASGPGELQVDCLVLDGRFALVVAEVVCVNEDLAADVRAAVGVEEVWVCATHTHSGPDVACRPGGGETPPEWRERIAAAAREAARGAQAECAATLHTGVLRDIGSPRGDATAPAAVSADLVTFTAGDALVGVLAVVPVHPTVVPAESNVVSGDLTAAIRESLAAPWAVVATGAAGDISTRRTRRAQTPEECARLGAEAAAQLAAFAETPGTLLWAAEGATLLDAPPSPAGEATVASRRRTLALPVRPQDRAELAALRDELTREEETAPASRTLTTALQGVAIAERRPDWGAELGVVLSAARLGGLRLLGIGGEPFHSFADDLRGDEPTVVLGYCNGHAGYLPDAAAFAEQSYEVLSSPFGPDAAAATVAALNELTPIHGDPQ